MFYLVTQPTFINSFGSSPSQMVGSITWIDFLIGLQSWKLLFFPIFTSYELDCANETLQRIFVHHWDVLTVLSCYHFITHFSWILAIISLICNFFPSKFCLKFDPREVPNSIYFFYNSRKGIAFFPWSVS